MNYLLLFWSSDKRLSIGFLMASLLISMNLFGYLLTPHVDNGFPSTVWNVSTPEEQSMNTTMLGEIENRYTDSEIDSIIVVRNGYIVYEEYPSGDDSPTQLHYLASVTKSVISALIGIAIDNGFIGSVDDSVIDFFPSYLIQNMDSRKESLTIEHLLTMTSGFEWDEWSTPYGSSNNSLTQMYESGNPVQFMLDIPIQDDPGSHWAYCSGGSHLLSAILQQSTGMSTYEFAMEFLFEPIGIEDAFWLIDSQGIYLGGGGLSLTPRDMARLGYLYLQNGQWNGDQVISENWIKQTFSPIVDLTTYDAYSYLWWLSPALGVTYASGLNGQRIYVFPDYNMVVVMTADMENQTIETELLTEYIIPSIIVNTGVPVVWVQISIVGLFLAPLIISFAYYHIRMAEFRRRLNI